MQDYIDMIKGNVNNITARDLLYYHSNIKSVDTFNQIKDKLQIKKGNN